MTQVIRQNTQSIPAVSVTTGTLQSNGNADIKPFVGADVFIQHTVVDGKVKKTTGEWGKVEAVYEDYTVRVKSGDVFSVKPENDHFKTVG